VLLSATQYPVSTTTHYTECKGPLNNLMASGFMGCMLSSSQHTQHVMQQHIAICKGGEPLVLHRLDRPIPQLCPAMAQQVYAYCSITMHVRQKLVQQAATNQPLQGPLSW
jgi:hypothetical protein